MTTSRAFSLTTLACLIGIASILVFATHMTASAKGVARLQGSAPSKGQRCSSCTSDSYPVCGADGKTYLNYCRLSCKGVSLLHFGACGGEPLFYNCPSVWSPVCGADGNTYSGTCQTTFSGIRVDHAGTCDGSSDQVCDPATSSCGVTIAPFAPAPL